MLKRQQDLSNTLWAYGTLNHKRNEHMRAINWEVMRQIEWFSPQGASYETEMETNDVSDLESGFCQSLHYVHLFADVVSVWLKSCYAWCKQTLLVHFWHPDVLTQSQVCQMWFGASLPLSIETCALEMKSNHPPRTRVWITCLKKALNIMADNEVPQSTWPGRLSLASVRRSFVVQWSSSRLPTSPRSMAVQILFLSDVLWIGFGFFCHTKTVKFYLYHPLKNMVIRLLYSFAVLAWMHEAVGWVGMVVASDHTLRELLFNYTYSQDIVSSEEATSFTPGWSYNEAWPVLWANCYPGSPAQAPPRRTRQNACVCLEGCGQRLLGHGPFGINDGRRMNRLQLDLDQHPPLKKETGCQL